MKPSKKIDRVEITPRFDGTVDIRVVRAGTREVVAYDVQPDMAGPIARNHAKGAPVVNLSTPENVHRHWGHA
jgi:hypothetical protein